MQHDFTGTSSGGGLALLLQQLGCLIGGCTGFGLQQLETPAFCEGSKRGVELALDRGDASLLPLRSVGV